MSLHGDFDMALGAGQKRSCVSGVIDAQEEYEISISNVEADNAQTDDAPRVSSRLRCPLGSAHREFWAEPPHQAP